MSTASRRNAAVKAPAGVATDTPLWNAALVVGALGAATWLLVSQGQLSWPPSELMASTYTIAGCLALVGPILVGRGRTSAADSGLGEWMWMSAGLLTWLFDLAGVLRGETALLSWATPVSSGTLGLMTLAVLIAGWRLQGFARAGRGPWRWTNVVGWVLGAYWIAMGALALLGSGRGGATLLG